MHVCFPKQTKKVEWIKIKSKTHDCFQWIQSVIISLRFRQASMASLKDKKSKVDDSSKLCTVGVKWRKWIQQREWKGAFQVKEARVRGPKTSDRSLACRRLWVRVPEPEYQNQPTNQANQKTHPSLSTTDETLTLSYVFWIMRMLIFF